VSGKRNALSEVRELRIAPPAVLRRSKGTRFSSPSDDEVGRLHRRDPRRASLASEAIKSAPPAVLRRSKGTRFSSPSDDEVGGLHRRDPRRAREEGNGFVAMFAPPICGKRRRNDACRTERGNQIGSRAPLSWTSERAGNFRDRRRFGNITGCERARKAADSLRCSRRRYAGGDDEAMRAAWSC
jgi:hypothetical protein